MAQFDLPLDDLRTYRPEVVDPTDFDEFWADTLAQARSQSGQVSSESAETPLDLVAVDDVTFPGFGGHPIKAWFSRPSNATAELPIVVQFQGYGGGRGLAIEHTFWPSAGYAHLMVDTRGQGSTWGSGGETPDPGGSAPAVPGYLTRGILDPAEYYYRRVFTDAVRAIDAARRLPGVDATRVVAAGGSQGGGIALAVAGLMPDIAAALIDVPFLANFRRAVAVTDEYPYQELTQYLAVHRGHAERAFATLGYFDGVNFARRAAAPALFSVGLMDQVCPPSTVFSAYNAYAGESKDIVVYPYNGHEGGGPHQTERQREFVSGVL